MRYIVLEKNASTKSITRNHLTEVSGNMLPTEVDGKGRVARERQKQMEKPLKLFSRFSSQFLIHSLYYLAIMPPMMLLMRVCNIEIGKYVCMGYIIAASLYPLAQGQLKIGHVACRV